VNQPEAQPDSENFIQKLEAATAEFVSGAPVKLEEDTKGQDITFTANNEFGVKYTFKLNGKISFTGTPG